MCGIAGFLTRGATGSDLAETLRLMTDQLVHRGPDSVGHWLDESVAVGLGHRRLSILDLSAAGCQPMHSASERYVCVLNGEIYNFRGLRASLSALGTRFRSETDTEVALAAFDRWGIPEALRRFVGMFALAVWDRLEQKLHLIRDRVGEKPLYFSRIGSTFIFGSELKSLRVHPRWSGIIDRPAIASFLRLGYVPGDQCIYQGVQKVSPGTFVTISAVDSSTSVTRYWSPIEAAGRGMKDPIFAGEQEIVSMLDVQLRETISQQMIADVPLGAFLSGGIDSSLVVALMQAQSPSPVHTFTIAFEEEGFNEAVHAAAVARHLGTEHTEFVVTGREARAVIPQLPTLYDEPFADSSQIPTHLVSSLARRHVTVSLSGDGGDELFGGYGRYTEVEKRWRRIGWMPRGVRATLAHGLTSVPEAVWDMLGRSRAHRLAFVRRINPSVDRIGRLADVLSAASHDQLYDAILSHWREASTVALGGPHAPPRGPTPALEMDVVPRMMLRDLMGYLPDDILVKVDRAAMGVSLETRAPFLDHRVVELAWRIPMDLKVKGGTGKWILRELLRKYVPTRLTDRPKMGFGIPLGAWLRGPLRDWADDLLEPSRLRAEGYLDPKLISRRWSEQRSGHRHWEHLIWDVLMFEAWLASHPAHRLAVAA